MSTHRDDVISARAKDSLRLAVTLAAGLALSAGLARAEGAAATPPNASHPASVAANANAKPNMNNSVAAKPAANTNPTTVNAAANAKPAPSQAGVAVNPNAKNPGVAPNAVVAGKSTNVLTRPLSPATPAANAKPGVVVPAPSAKSMSGVSSTTPKVVVPAAELDDHVTYQYNTLGRRDPFQSMVDGEFVGQDVGGDAPPDVGGLKVVGIVWGDSDRFALVEDGRGNSSVLRRGDKVMNGVVEDLKRDAVVVNLTVDGQSQSVTIPLTRKGDKANANR